MIDLRDGGKPVGEAKLRKEQMFGDWLSAGMLANNY
jgi:hypothetical protein